MAAGIDVPSMDLAPASSVPPQAAAQRNRELDGVRGWAAMAVIVQHLVYNTFSPYVPALEQIPYILRDGSFAVVVFFVLSGDALSARFLRDFDLTGVRKLALSRYFRLTGMVLLSCLVMYLLLVSGLAPHRQAAAMIGNMNWFDSALDFPPSLLDAIGYSLYRVYTEFGWHPQDSYNPFLWTMSVELVGSALIFGYMLIYSGLRYKVATTLVVMVFSSLVSPYAPLFFLGMLIGIARSRGVLSRQAARPLWRATAIGLLVFFALYDSYGTPLGEGIKGVFAGLLVWAAGSVPLLKRALTSRLSRFLGDISFPLYAFQFPVMMSFTALAIIVVGRSGQLTVLSALAIIAASMVAMIAAATLAERVERLYLRGVARAIDRITLRTTTAGPDQRPRPMP
jgi:peptidoglycan/LPS O-acetylase OafA/YrhL